MWGATMPDACSNAIMLIAKGKIGLGEDSNAGMPYVSVDMRETNDALEEAIRGLESESPADVAKNSPVMGYQLDDQPDSLRYYDHESKQVKQTDVKFSQKHGCSAGNNWDRAIWRTDDDGSLSVDWGMSFASVITEAGDGVSFNLVGTTMSNSALVSAWETMGQSYYGVYETVGLNESTQGTDATRVIDETGATRPVHATGSTGDTVHVMAYSHSEDWKE